MELMRWRDWPSLRRAAGGAAVALALLAAGIWTAVDRRELRSMKLETPHGTIAVEVADTPAARSAGLSNRESLGGVDGLLLKWDAPGRHPIWMAEMRFPLDLVWLDRDGRVVGVLTNVPPCRANPCSLYEPDGTDRTVAVLEMPAGGAASRRLAVGAIVRFSTGSGTR
jgi:uncharacterized membrane protein (UPF0127 family)